MTKWIKRLSSFYLLFTALTSFAQDTPLGTWRNHFSFQNARLLTSGEGKIFCATENGLFFLDQADRSISKLSKQQGLSDVGASSIAYDENTHTLLIGYSTGLVDLVTSEAVVTIRDIHETNLPGAKNIRDIVIHQDNAYLATSFGVVVVSLLSKEIVETFRSIGESGKDATIFNLEIVDHQLFALLDQGIQSGNLNTNLLDFNNWNRYEETFSKRYADIAAVDGQLFAIAGNQDLAFLQDGTWSDLALEYQGKLVDLYSHNNTLYVLSESAIYTLENDDLTLFKNLSAVENANSFLYHNGFWVADGEKGLLTPDEQFVVPNGPVLDKITRLSFTNEKLYALYGSAGGIQNEQIDSSGYSVFNNESWQSKTIDGFYNITDVEFFNDELYFSSAGFGLYKSTSNELINHTNSDLSRGWFSTGPVITQLEVSEQLYLVSHDSISSLYTSDREGNFTIYSAEYVDTEAPASILISENGIVWIVRSEAYGGGIVVLDLENDDYRLINTGSNLPANRVNDVALDHNDDAWIATGGGPAIFPDASFPFDGFNATEPIFENRELFENESISSIAVDGGNRIWMSTGSGIYVFNNSLSELVDQFNTANSPLPSNRVIQFAYNGTNGEMFILTDKGLVSLRTGSSAGGATHNQVNIFPNPVRPGYSGLVGISGLVTDASLKITDVNGKLVRQLNANGGTASWDLLDYNRNRVNTGVYIIFSSSFDGEETFIGKIAVVN